MFLSSELLHEGRAKTGNRLGGGGPAGDHVSRLLLTPSALGPGCAGTSPSRGTARACIPGPCVLSLGARPLCLPGNRRGRGFCWCPPCQTQLPCSLWVPTSRGGAEQPEHSPSSRGGVPVRAESEPGRSCWLAGTRRIATLFVTGPLRCSYVS